MRMPRLTKTQAKRLITDILSKTQKLYMSTGQTRSLALRTVVNTKDMEAVERLTEKWLKRLG